MRHLQWANGGVYFSKSGHNNGASGVLQQSLNMLFCVINKLYST